MCTFIFIGMSAYHRSPDQSDYHSSSIKLYSDCIGLTMKRSQVGGRSIV